MPPIVLFDIDKTLVAKSTAHIRAFITAVRETYGVEAALSVSTHHGMTDQQILRAVLAEKGVSPSAVESGLPGCLDLMVERFDAYNATDTVELLPGVLPLLEELSGRGCRLGLVTGNLEKIAWGKLGRAGIARYFSFGGFGSDHMDRRELAAVALNRCRILYPDSAESPVALFGDTPSDVAAGRAIGALAVGVATGHPTKESLLTAGADVVFDDLSDIKAVIEAVFRRKAPRRLNGREEE
jgi:phosphoglycolate phosphatase